MSQIEKLQKLSNLFGLDTLGFKIKSDGYGEMLAVDHKDISKVLDLNKYPVDLNQFRYNDPDTYNDSADFFLCFSYEGDDIYRFFLSLPYCEEYRKEYRVEEITDALTDEAYRKISNLLASSEIVDKILNEGGQNWVDFEIGIDKE